MTISTNPWRKIEAFRMRRYLFVVSPFIYFGIGVLTGNMLLAIIVATIFALAGAIYAIGLIFVSCPNCGESFYGNEFQHALFSRRCCHCKTKIGEPVVGRQI